MSPEVLTFIFSCVIAAGGIVFWLRARRFRHRLEDLRAGLAALRNGDTEVRFFDGYPGVFGKIAHDLNAVTKALDVRTEFADVQTREKDTILSTLREGIIAIDSHKKVLWLNRAARALLEIQKDGAEGRSIEEVVQDAPLQRFIHQSFQVGAAQEAELVLARGDERYLRVYANPLILGEDSDRGALLVLSDITKLRKLENVRKDFVANVSHELMTPITSIKGFVETLLDGAIDTPQDARRFLDIIFRQTERLKNIFQDLLSLSKIEEDRERQGIPLARHSIKAVFETVAQDCEAYFREKNVSLAIEGDTSGVALINASLLEQALSNLLTNAAKYSDPSGRVVLRVVDHYRCQPSDLEFADSRRDFFATQPALRFEVEDFGCGIERAHLARIFERFYRVDGARSRKLGGTGLGLSIVKHIAQAHGGFAAVQSTIGKGSTFALIIPESARMPLS